MVNDINVNLIKTYLKEKNVKKRNLAKCAEWIF